MEKEGIVFLKYNGALLKLSVKYDVSALEEIRDEMIRDCSIIRKVKDKREIDYSLNTYQGNPHYQNVHRYVVKYPYIDESYDGDESTPGEQIVSYDYYEYPSLAYDLNNICNSCIGGRYGFGLTLKPEVEDKPIKERIVSSMNDIIDDRTLDNEERLKRLGELSDLLRSINSGEVIYPIQDVSSFNKRILDAIEIKVIGSCEVGIVDTLIDLFGFKNNEERVITDLITDIDSLDETLKYYVVRVLTPQLSSGQKLKKINNNN